jgi:hypothetical protein
LSAFHSITALHPSAAQEDHFLPKNAFERKKEEYEAIGPPFISLNFSPAPHLKSPQWFAANKSSRFRLVLTLGGLG